MPRVYTTKEERNKAKVKRWLKSVLARRGVQQKAMAISMGLSQQGLSAAITRGSVSLVQLLDMHKQLHFTERDIGDLLGKLGEDDGYE